MPEYIFERLGVQLLPDWQRFYISLFKLGQVCSLKLLIGMQRVFGDLSSGCNHFHQRGGKIHFYDPDGSHFFGPVVPVDYLSGKLPVILTVSSQTNDLGMERWTMQFMKGAHSPLNIKNKWSLTDETTKSYGIIAVNFQMDILIYPQRSIGMSVVRYRDQWLDLYTTVRVTERVKNVGGESGNLFRLKKKCE